MAFDFQGLNLVITAVGAVGTSIIAGLYTGRMSARKDANEAQMRRSQFDSEREKAEEIASTARIEAIAADAAAARLLLRQNEDDYRKREREFYEREVELRKESQRGWDLAAYHFGIVGVLFHLLNGVFQLVSLSEKPDPQRVVDGVRFAQKRMEAVKIPLTLEEPLTRKPA